MRVIGVRGKMARRLAVALITGTLFGIVIAGIAQAQDDPAALRAEVEKLDQEGKYAQATEAAKRVLAIQEKAQGSDHPDIGVALHTLAGLYRKRGQYAEAEPLYWRLLPLSEKAFGHEHLTVGISLNQLAVLYKSQGRYAEAEPFYKRSLAILEKTVQSEYPLVPQLLSDLAGLYQNQGRYADAEALFKRSLTIQEKALGVEHLDVAGSLNNLAELYRVQGRYGEAEPLLRSIAVGRTATGDHRRCFSSNGVGSRSKLILRGLKRCSSAIRCTMAVQRAGRRTRRPQGSIASGSTTAPARAGECGQTE